MSSSGNSGSKKSNKKFASLRDYEADEGGHGSGDDDSDRGQEYFAGGDKSGLAVRNPADDGPDNERVRRLLQTARARGAMPQPPAAPAPRPSHFTGTGQTLGGDDTPSRIVESEEPVGRAGGPRPMVERILHLWSDGFSVDDGPLYRYDDPANQATLDMINRGAAPMELMNVEHGQDVDVKLLPHRGEKYVAKYKPFSSSGQRLGSPTPGPSSSSASGPSDQGEASGTSAASDTAAEPKAVTVDESQPTLVLQIRLGDGTRLQSRFNATHTVGDVYSFVNGASAESASRAYVLMTTFPSKELTDREQVLGDMAEFKRGGVVVQKWQ